MNEGPKQLLERNGEPQPGRRERKRLETRQRIFTAAVRLFAERGFAGTTVEDITEAADVGKGTFFNYFPTKEHVLQHFGELQISRIDAWLRSTQTSKKPARQMLKELLAAVTAAPAENPEIVGIMVGAFLAQQAIRDSFKTSLALGRSKLAEFFEAAQRRGELRQDIDAETLARALQQSIFGTLLLWSLHRDVPLEEYLKPTFEVLWAGVHSTEGKIKPTRVGRQS